MKLGKPCGLAGFFLAGRENVADRAGSGILRKGRVAVRLPSESTSGGDPCPALPL
jgi:hypothetical protein